jgi:hypothetical protein
MAKTLNEALGEVCRELARISACYHLDKAADQIADQIQDSLVLGGDTMNEADRKRFEQGLNDLKRGWRTSAARIPAEAGCPGQR